MITTCYLINRTHSSLLKEKSPLELLHGYSPPYSHIKIFGCLASAHDDSFSKDKLRARSRPCVFSQKFVLSSMTLNIRNLLSLGMLYLMKKHFRMILGNWIWKILIHYLE